jgi:hypothetical protein
VLHHRQLVRIAGHVVEDACHEFSFDPSVEDLSWPFDRLAALFARQAGRQELPVVDLLGPPLQVAKEQRDASAPLRVSPLD